MSFRTQKKRFYSPRRRPQRENANQSQSCCTARRPSRHLQAFRAQAITDAKIQTKANFHSIQQNPTHFITFHHRGWGSDSPAPIASEPTTASKFKTKANFDSIQQNSTHF